jgi:hypothetical protein
VVDAGFDRSRLATFQMSLATADYPQPAPRAQLYQRLLEKLRGVAGIQGASAMSGLPPNRPLNANDTDIAARVASGSECCPERRLANAPAGKGAIYVREGALRAD